MRTMQRIREEPAPAVRSLRADVPADLEAICGKCLEKDPRDRYRSAQELADDLGNFLEDRPVQAQPPGFWDWIRQLARIHPDPEPNPFWPVTAWFGAIVLLTNAFIYFLVRFEGPSVWLWVATIVSGVAMWVVLWRYMLRRFREVPVTDRHSLIIATGHIFMYFPVLAAYAPLSFSAAARDGLPIFPIHAACTGLGLFTLGSTNWSRFFPIGIGMMMLTPVLTFWPDESPLIYGGAHAAVMWFWSYSKSTAFGAKPAAPSLNA